MYRPNARLTAVLLSSARGRYANFSLEPRQFGPPPPMKCSAMEADIIQQEIDVLLRKRVIMPTEIEDGDFFSNIFLVAKKDGTHRMILN